MAASLNNPCYTGSDADLASGIGHVLYIAVLIFIGLFISALPFISTEVSVKSKGVFQAATSRVLLYAGSSGMISEIKVRENQQVRRGDTILTLNTRIKAEQLGSLVQRRSLISGFLADIKLIDNALTHHVPHDIHLLLRTSQFQALWEKFLAEADRLEIDMGQGERKLRRYSYLYQGKAITLAEYETARLQYDQSVAAYNMLRSDYISRLQEAFSSYSKEIREIEVQEREYKQQIAWATVTSPLEGSVQGLSGLEKGSYLASDQKIGEISPASVLYADCFIEPSDAGLVKVGQKVLFRVDAFNYNRWGMLSGKVDDISDDVILLNDRAVFRVRCSLDKDHLELKGKNKGSIRKGMTFTASFKLAERSLFQLLSDRMEDWLNGKSKGKSGSGY